MNAPLAPALIGTRGRLRDLTLSMIHARWEADAQVAADTVRRAFRIEAGPPAPGPRLQWHAAVANAA